MCFPNHRNSESSIRLHLEHCIPSSDQVVDRPLVGEFLEGSSASSDYAQCL
jgi:hypothetical protein